VCALTKYRDQRITSDIDDHCMKIAQDQINDIAILKLTKELPWAMGDCTVLEDCIHRLVQRGTTRIIVDMTSAHLISTEGIGTLIHGLKIVKEAGGIIHLVRRYIMGPITITALYTLFGVFETVDQAMDAFEGI
jgi:anti-sigma B factor antagonist